MSISRPPAVLLQHPSAPVQLEPVPAPSPRIAGIVERVRAKFSQPKFTEGEAVRLDRLDALGRLMDAHGDQEIVTLATNLAKLRAELRSEGLR